MDFLKNQLARLQQQFNQLTASQKMLSVSLVAIMVMTLLWWGRYAGTAEMEPVVDQDLAPEQVAQLTGELRSRGIPVSSNGSRVLVAADRKSEALGVLLYSGSIPQEASSTIVLDIMNKSTNALSSSEQSDRAYNAAREAMLASIIRGFPGVKFAAVVLGPPTRIGFSEEPSSSATVHIQSRNPGSIDKHLAPAAAALLMGAQPTLKKTSIQVIVDGSLQKLPGDGPLAFDGSSALDEIANAQTYYSNIVQQHLSFIEGVMVQVAVNPDNKMVETNSTTYDPKSVVSKETENQTEKNTSNQGGGPGGVDPGITANTGGQVADSTDSRAGGMTKNEKSDVKTENFVPKTETKTQQIGRDLQPKSASVFLPRSFFIKQYKAETQTDKDPTATLLEPYIKSKSDKYKSIVSKCLTLPNDDAVVIEAYADAVPQAATAPTQSVGAVSMMLTGHAKEIALGALAIISLFMVSMMVRKSAPALAMAGGLAVADGGSGAGSTVDTLLAKAAGVKGPMIDPTKEVGEGHQSLDGVELDDEQVRQQQVMEQVSALVKDNPDAAANLIKRWMNRT